MTIVTIAQKISNSGSIHDISSDMMDREIKFPVGHIYAVVDAAYYGGKGYTTHKTEEATIRASRKNREYSHRIVGADGCLYEIEEGYNARLIEVGKI